MKTFAAVLFSGLLLAGPALADSITITGGFTTIDSSNFGAVHVLGDRGLQFDGSIDDAGGISLCQVCRPGPLISSLDGVSIPADMNRHAAQVVFNGATFLFPSGLNGRNSQGFLHFDYHALVFPAGGPVAPIDVTAPFTFTGFLRVFGPDTAADPLPALTPPLDLIGEGLLTVHLGELSSDGARQRLSYRYDFITPEPSTWLLFGTGLLSLIGFRKRLAAS